MQAQKSVAVSELDLHQEMYELTIAIRNLFADYTDRVVRIEKTFKDENQTIDTNRNQARAENSKREADNRKSFSDANGKASSQHDRDLRRAKSRLSEAEGSIQTLRHSLEKMTSWAGEHMRQQGVEPDIIQLEIQHRSSGKTSKPFEAANEHYRKAETMMTDLREIRRPERLIWPNSNGAGLGLMGFGLLVALLFSYVLDLGFGVGLFFFGVVYIGGIVLLHISASKKLKVAFSDWLRVKQVVEAYLDRHRSVVVSAFEDERKQVSALLEERKVKAQQTLDQESKLRTDELRALESRFQRMSSESSVRHQQSLDATRVWLAGQTEGLHEQCATLTMTTGFVGADWNSALWDNWAPPSYPASITRFGKLNLSMNSERHIFPNIKLDFSLPAVTQFAGGRCLLFETSADAKDPVIRAVQSAAIRLLATIPPGKVRFTLFDPVGLGQNVAALMPLGDYDESLIQSRAWTEPQHIEEQLAKLTEHMETVIQKYLRSDFSTIEDYNKQAGEIAEPYRVLLVLDFPVNFSEAAARRLVSIARNGPRCGVFTIVLRDAAKKLPYQFNVADLEQSSTVIKYRDGRFIWSEKDLDKCSLALDESPQAEITNRIIKETGERSIDAMKVQVPYPKLLELAGLTGNARWQATTEKRVQVPLGPTGARKLQTLTLGEGTAHHAIIIGRTGSGKSNLMHVIITTLALKYSPEEMRLYLIDFKQGVEFKPYAESSLPHAEVIAIESEREFGLSVLNGLNDKLHERGETFRKVGVNNITEYRQKTGQKIPRILLLVDEFQEFFTQEDNIARQATMIMDRLVRQGRYAGIHLMLGSQNLAASRSIPTSTINQMGIRIALQSSDADARQILADDNPAARLLSRPGEAIYNSASGLIEGNNFFQVALFTDTDRKEQLDQISKAYKGASAPRIFEGNEPASIEKCQPLVKLLSDREWPAETKSPTAWVGEPIAIKEPTSVCFRRQSGSHLLVVTRDEEEGIGILTATVLGLAAQQGPDRAHFFNVDLTTVDTTWENMAEDSARLLPHNIDVLGRRDVPRLLQDLVTEVSRRVESDLSSEPSIYLVIQGIQRARDLRLEEVSSGVGFSGSGEATIPSAAKLLARLLKDGPEVGIHLMVWCDSYSNLKHVLEPRLLSEFGLRVAGPMSNEDSMRLLDDPSASRLDKPHRAIYYEEERPGYLEKFRPYALPESEWFTRTAQRMRARMSKAQSA
jgi:S-DNA-T family DNA segregation ATPase FtsK/SpoIIIE